MLNQLLKFTLVSGFLLWLRRRWKWLAACGGVIAAAMYLHGEFLDYVEALPSGSEEATVAGDYIAVAFAIKNVVIFASLLTYFLVEMRASKRRRKDRTAAVDAGTTEPRPSPRRGSVRGDDSKADDGFDFLRHGRKLENRADKVIGSKRAK
ncbi:MAG: hypothetical protein F4029_10575 [Gammaproteobacteria bacterium]|nr:hypothetical protein [Gammaproteobacteria bacterium]MYF31722.1 hypothetical protein [Gammaproteobacteria bacterium]MYK46658.1 hypothetical protein [Gammaproteobacteria bacterium]